MQNCTQQNGNHMTFVAPGGGVVSGSGYRIGALFVVALASAAEAAEFVGVTEGVFTLPKTSAQAWTEGQRIYWDDTNDRADSDASVGALIGVAAAVAANPSSTGSVRLNGSAPDLDEGAQAAIADLALPTLTDSPATADALRDDLTANWEAAIEGKVNAMLAAMRAAKVIAT